MKMPEYRRILVAWLVFLGFAVATDAMAGEGVQPAAKDQPAAHSQPQPGRMEWFQDQKFGLFMHWGIYSELGCIESWPLVWADRSWSNPQLKTLDEMLAFRQKYFALNQKFNPAEIPARVVGGRRQTRRDEVRDVHDQASRRILHVRHETDRLQGHRAGVPVQPESAGQHRGRGVRGVSPGGLRHRLLLFQIGLAQPVLLEPGDDAAGPQSELRHGEGAGAVGQVRPVCPRARSRNWSRTTARSTSCGWTAARFVRQVRTSTWTAWSPWPAAAAAVDRRGPHRGTLRGLPHAGARGSGKAAAVLLGNVHDDGRSMVLQARRQVQTHAAADSLVGRHRRQGRQLPVERRPAAGWDPAAGGGVATGGDRPLDGRERRRRFTARGRFRRTRKGKSRTRRKAKPCTPSTWLATASPRRQPWCRCRPCVPNRVPKSACWAATRCAPGSCRPRV